MMTMIFCSRFLLLLSFLGVISHRVGDSAPLVLAPAVLGFSADNLREQKSLPRGHYTPGGGLFGEVLQHVVDPIVFDNHWKDGEKGKTKGRPSKRRGRARYPRRDWGHGTPVPAEGRVGDTGCSSRDVLRPLGVGCAESPRMLGAR